LIVTIPEHKFRELVDRVAVLEATIEAESKTVIKMAKLLAALSQFESLAHAMPNHARPIEVEVSDEEEEVDTPAPKAKKVKKSASGWTEEKRAEVRARLLMGQRRKAARAAAEAKGKKFNEDRWVENYDPDDYE
jgi:hypothetical protein